MIAQGHTPTQTPTRTPTHPGAPPPRPSAPSAHHPRKHTKPHPHKPHTPAAPTHAPRGGARHGKTGNARKTVGRFEVVLTDDVVELIGMKQDGHLA